MNWNTEYLFTYETGGHGSITPANNTWYPAGTSVTITLSCSPDTQGTTRDVFTQWSDCSASTSTSVTITMNAALNCVANWKTQYQLTTSTAYGSISPATGTWYDSGASVTVSLSGSPTTGSGGTRNAFDTWSGCSTSTSTSISLTMSAARSCTAGWKTQYQFNFTTPYGSITPASGTWYDSGATVSVTLSCSPTTPSSGTRYTFDVWSSCSTASTTSISLTMTAAQSCTAEWLTQYQFTYTSPFGSISPTSGTWYDSGASFTVTLTGSPSNQSTSRAVFTAWSDCSTSTSQSITVTMSAARNCVANWNTEYLFTYDTGGHGSISPANNTWYPAGTLITVTLSGSSRVHPRVIRR